MYLQMWSHLHDVSESILCPPELPTHKRNRSASVAEQESNKYSDRSFGLLGGKVTHTFLLINSPSRLADHGSVLVLGARGKHFF